VVVVGADHERGVDLVVVDGRHRGGHARRGDRVELAPGCVDLVDDELLLGRGPDDGDRQAVG